MIVIVLREREGKAGGGKGFLLNENKSFTLATSNFQVIFYGNRVGDIRVQDDKVNTLQARMGTGGNNMPLLAEVYPIDDAREIEKHQNGTGIGNEGDPAYTLDRQQAPAVVQAFDTYNQTVSEKNQTLRHQAADNDHIGTIWENSIVRRLTPMECERLQGFPDGWTEGQSDTHRYKQMGNAVAVPVVQWIIDRITK